VTIRSRSIEYKAGSDGFEGLLAWDDAVAGPRPGVLVSHAWGGRDAFADGKASALAELGYVGFALDLYGKGVRGKDRDACAALMRPFLEDRSMLQARMQLALDTMRAQDEVDSARTAAIGFCFGGLCVLDLARSGADVAGVVSFHGFLHGPGSTRGNAIRAKVLALHGWDDPMVKPDQVPSFAEEMSRRGADWQLHAYGNTMHAFTNPVANDPDFGTVYSDVADRRSWRLMQDFLAEALGRRTKE
jgi:dienelactone hydrolase